jgi:hypothetical protein
VDSTVVTGEHLKSGTGDGTGEVSVPLHKEQREVLPAEDAAGEMVTI